MSARILETSGHIITAEITGLISPAELATAQQEILGYLTEWGSGAILCICEEFKGWAAGDWGDLSFQMQADSLISKMAIIGEEQWKDLAMTFTGKGFRPFPIGYFETGRQEEARAWLQG